ncbi:DUF2505 domain-containing protein [Mycobacterium deserti]|uniref:DUF2505 domain-containing protein n=1 Tax=Mycobacterium deserti TaxID=2978347 RepID=A0ABT2M8G4_9MYCO|nr:DUF2505 domain-containing protein [Mycobacterium deserti]MCT7658558.1 DUF2505 domain-containing protein [Mycobacterium deserti]
MARRMDHTITFDAPVEKMYQDLTSRDYWQTLIEVYQQFTPSAITSFTSSENGTDIVFVQELPWSELPSIARAVIPSDMVITRKQHFDPYDHANNCAEGTYSAAIPKGPGRFGGRYFLTETDTGSQLRLASECKVWIPLVGGALEDLILHHIRYLFDGEEAFAADWIAKHH